MKKNKKKYRFDVLEYERFQKDMRDKLMIIFGDVWDLSKKQWEKILRGLD